MLSEGLEERHSCKPRNVKVSSTTLNVQAFSLEFFSLTIGYSGNIAIPCTEVKGPVSVVILQV